MNSISQVAHRSPNTGIVPPWLIVEADANTGIVPPDLAGRNTGVVQPDLEDGANMALHAVALLQR